MTDNIDKILNPPKQETVRVSFRSDELSTIVSSLAPIANNNKMPVEKVVSFFVYDDKFAMTSTDKIVYASIEGKCICKEKVSFAVRIEDLVVLVKSAGTLTLDIEEDIIIATRGDSKIQIMNNPTIITPFRVDDGTFELVPATKMLKVIQSLSHYISVDMNEFNAVMLSDGYGYVRDRLCYMITPLAIKETVTFSKMMAKQFTAIFNKSFAQSPDGRIAVRFNPETSLTEMSAGDANFRMKSFDYTGTDLSAFIKISNGEGNAMSRTELLDRVRELIILEKCTDVIVSLEKNRTRLLPKKDGTRTSLIINSASSAKVDYNSDFNFTTNLKYLEKVLSGMNSNTVAIAKQGNVCVIINEEREITIRYFLTTY